MQKWWCQISRDQLFTPRFSSAEPRRLKCFQPCPCGLQFIPIPAQGFIFQLSSSYKPTSCFSQSGARGTLPYKSSLFWHEQVERCSCEQVKMSSNIFTATAVHTGVSVHVLHMQLLLERGCVFRCLLYESTTLGFSVGEKGRESAACWETTSFCHCLCNGSHLGPHLPSWVGTGGLDTKKTWA